MGRARGEGLIGVQHPLRDELGPIRRLRRQASGELCWEGAPPAQNHRSRQECPDASSPSASPAANEGAQLTIDDLLS